MIRLVNLPLHVVVIAREKDDVVKQGGEMVRVGVKADAEKGTAYTFDVVANLTVTRTGARTATILKDRTGTHATGAQIADPTFAAIFGKVLRAKKAKDAPQRHVASDADAAHEDATSMGTKLATPLQVAALVEALTAAGYDPDEVRQKKGWLPYDQMGAKEVEDLTRKIKALVKSETTTATAVEASPTQSETTEEAVA
jgi:hypothetical protein